MEFVGLWPLFTDTAKPDKGKETGFDMIPEQTHREKLVCMMAARNVPGLTAEEAYRHRPYGWVIEQLALAMASQYSPPPDERPKGPT